MAPATLAGDDACFKTSRPTHVVGCELMGDPHAVLVGCASLDESRPNERMEEQPTSFLSPTDFRARCAREGGACSVEMGQESVIALLLKQQEEMMRELRDQKKELALSQANKHEIARLVLSSIEKQQLRSRGPAPLRTQQHSQAHTTTRTGRATRGKHARRRKKSRSIATRVVSDGEKNTEPRDPYGCPLTGPEDIRESPYFPSPEDGTYDKGGEPLTTIIRQRMEKQAEQAEVSMEGLWLPSLPSPSSNNAPPSAHSRRRWADPSPCFTTAPSSRACDTIPPAPDTDKNRTRPATVATQVFSENKSVAGATSDVAARSGAATAGVSAPKRTRYVDSDASRMSETGRVASPRSFHEAEAQSDNERDVFEAPKDSEPRSTPGNRGVCETFERNCADGGGRETPLSNPIADRLATEREGHGYRYRSNAQAPMSQHTAAMLERSRMLVAKAKACCGQAIRSTSPCRDKEGAGGSDSGAVQVRGRAGSITGGDSNSARGDNAGSAAMAGETGSILFPVLSPGSLGGDAIDGELGRSSVNSGRSIVGERGESGGSGVGGIEAFARDATYGIDDGPGDIVSPGEKERRGDSTPQSRMSGVVTGVYENVSLRCATATSSSRPLYQPATAKPRATTAATPTTAAVDAIADSEEQRPGGMTTSRGQENVGSACTGSGNDLEDCAGSTARLGGSLSCGRKHNRRRQHGSSDGVTGREGSKRAGSVGRTGASGRSNYHGGSPVKVDTEWENEIAKNILSLYQTKLKAELDEKRGAREEEGLGRKLPGYLTAQEEEHLKQTQQQRQRQQQQQQQRRNETAGQHQRRLSPSSADTAKRSPSSPQRFFSSRSATASGAESVRFSSRDNKTEDASKPPYTAGGGAVGTKALGKTTPTRGRRGLRTSDSRTRLSPGKQGETGLCRGPLRRRPSTAAAFADVSPSYGPTFAKKNAHASSGSGGDGGGGAGCGTGGRGGFRGSRAISVPTRGGGEAVVVVPKRPSPIWFAGTGAVQAEWSALPGGVRVVRDLEGLEEQGRYSKYVAVVEGLLAAHLRADDQRGPTELVKRLWRQLVVTCMAFGIRSTENQRYERALELLKRAEILLSRQVLDKKTTSELRGFVSDAYGLYYLRRGKSSAALDYVQKAMRTHARMQDWGHVAKCHLHSAVVLSKLNRHDEALRCLGQVLSMVQEGKLDVGGNSPQKLCLVAICYHNMAVEQLILRHAGEACMSSQNARRLARLCLSYSNRWLHSFEGTHKLALAELARVLPSGGEEAGEGRTGGEGREMLKRLAEELFS